MTALQPAQAAQAAPEPLSPADRVHAQHRLRGVDDMLLAAVRALSPRRRRFPGPGT